MLRPPPPPVLRQGSGVYNITTPPCPPRRDLMKYSKKVKYGPGGFGHSDIAKFLAGSAAALGYGAYNRVFNKAKPKLGVAKSRDTKKRSGWSPTLTIQGKKKKSSARPAQPGHGPRRVRRVKRTRKDPFVSAGFKNTAEVTGLVTDPDCVYLAHSAMTGEGVLECAVAALLRKLIFKATGWNCPGIDVGIPTELEHDKIVIYRVNKGTGIESEFDMILSAGYTIRQIVGNKPLSISPIWTNLMIIFRDFASSTSLNTMQVDIPTKIRYFVSDVDVITTYHLCGEVVLQNEKIHLMSISDIKFQNRTLSADADNEGDAVSNNPITGYRYKFSSAVPKARNDGIPFLEVMSDYTGVITQRGVDFTTPGMKEPPSGRQFYNCTGTSKVTLQPGEIKKSRLSHTEVKSFNNFFRGLGYGTTSLGLRTQLRGPSEMFSLEDVINFNGSQLINLAYEVNRVVGVYWTTHSQRFAIGAFDQLTQSKP